MPSVCKKAGAATMAADQNRSEHLATLDVLRVLAALAVVAFHYVFRGTAGVITPEQMNEIAPNIAIYGYLGVNLFFVISGFVIAWSAQGRNWSDFAIARAARLYPGFVVCMTATFLALMIAADPRFPVDLVQYGANLAMFSPALGQPFVDGVYWSIILELIFYGWVAVALMLGVFDRWRLEIIAGWLALCVINQFWLESGVLRMVCITEFGALFCAGMLFQYIDRHGRSTEAFGLLAAAFLISTACMADMRDWMIAHYGVAVPLPGLAIANAVIFGLVAAALHWRPAVPSTALVVALGGMTYPLYLLHQNIGYLAIEALEPHTGKTAAIAAVTFLMIAAALTVWGHIEPYGRRFVRTVLGSGRDRLFAMAERLRTQKSLERIA
jgi:peptidoglycan/LPS O-acetylase OafA/YrhL